MLRKNHLSSACTSGAARHDGLFFFPAQGRALQALWGSCSSHGIPPSGNPEYQSVDSDIYVEAQIRRFAGLQISGVSKYLQGVRTRSMERYEGSTGFPETVMGFNPISQLVSGHQQGASSRLPERSSGLTACSFSPPRGGPYKPLGVLPAATAFRPLETPNINRWIAIFT